MEVNARSIVYLRLENGKSPFLEWIQALASLDLRAAVDARVERVRDGNFGNHKGIGSCLFELVINRGPGLRVYYAIHDDSVVLINGGTKKSQQTNIEEAKRLWRSVKDASRRL